MFIKIFVSIILFSFSFTFACKKTESLQNLTLESGKIIIEITSDFRGSLWMNGKVLDFRLFKDGTIEYDQYPLQSQNGMLYAEQVKVTKQRKISESEIREIINLLESDDFLKLKDKIAQDKSCIDAFRDAEINFRLNNKRKNIFINNCANLADPESTSFYYKDFPIILNKLFHFFEK